MKTGDSINGYKLLKSCGRGAFGEVFLADSFMGNKVALKVIKLEGMNADRELQALRDYNKCCPNEFLMTIFHADQKDDYFFYTMELADNLNKDEDNDESYIADTLQKRLERNGPFSVKETTDLAIQLLNGLKILHSHDLIHRDIKPANILWFHGQAKLGDIGLLAHDRSMTCQAGTPGFMPPSNFGIRSNSPQVDLYALAQVLYCCLTGIQDTDLDVLELTDDLKANGKTLLNTINRVCRKNSPIKTADQFLKAITTPVKKKKTASKTKSEKKAKSKSSTIPQDTGSCELDQDITEERISSKSEYSQDKHSVTDTILNVGIPALSAMIPGGALVKGLTAGTLLATKGLFKYLNKDRELEDLRDQKEDIEWQKEDMRRQLEDARRQMEAIERQKKHVERMNEFLSSKIKKDNADS